MNLAITGDITKTMEYFGEWQHKINPVDDSHPNHHDVAVLITRYVRQLILIKYIHRKFPLPS